MQGRLSDKHKSASKDELLEMIRFGADTVIRMGDVDSADFDIEDVLAAGKKKTVYYTHARARAYTHIHACTRARAHTHTQV